MSKNLAPTSDPVTVTPDDPEKLSGLAAMKNAAKEKADQYDTHTLPSSGVVVEYPVFKNHGKWAAALRLTKKNDIHQAQVNYIVSVCKFDGERITATDFNAYVDLSESVPLIAKVFSDDDDDVGEA